jgi:hypothetical protein
MSGDPSEIGVSRRHVLLHRKLQLLGSNVKEADPQPREPPEEGKAEGDDPKRDDRERFLAESLLSPSGRDRFLFGPEVDPESFLLNGTLLINRLQELKRSAAPALVAAFLENRPLDAPGPLYSMLRAAATGVYCSWRSSASADPVLSPVGEAVMAALTDMVSAVFEPMQNYVASGLGLKDQPLRVGTADLAAWLQEEIARSVHFRQAADANPSDKIAAARLALSLSTIAQFEAALALGDLESSTTLIAPHPPELGDPYIECCHQPTSTDAAIHWWKHQGTWAALCDHCHSRASLGNPVEMAESRPLKNVTLARGGGAN